MGKKQSKKPTGLKITRDGYKFTFSWKTGESYESQELEWTYAPWFKNSAHTKPDWLRRNHRGGIAHGHEPGETLWYTLSIKKGTTSKTYNDPDLLEIAAIKFRVKGKAKNKSESEWNTETYILKPPNDPSIAMSATNAYTSAFSWSTDGDKTKKQAFIRNEWQTLLATNCNITTGQADSSLKTGWSNIAISGAKSSTTIEEKGWDTVKNSYTRWVRVRSIGWADMMSGWKYARRIYASPKAATNVSATRSPFGGSGYSVTVTWNSPETYDRPIDNVTIGHGTAVPNVSVEYPSGNGGTVKMTISAPSNIGWTETKEAGGIRGKRTYSYVDASNLENDNCYFINVINKHDSNESPSMIVMASGGAGLLASPSAPTAEPSQSDSSLYTVSVSNRGTSITNAAIAVYFRTSSAQGKIQCIGIIPPGASNTTCKIPDVPSSDTISFGVRAFVGNYTPYQASSLDSVTIFKPTLTMQSEIVWGSGVPRPPVVTAEAKDESSIIVTWNQTWADATRAELSWSEEEDSWSSTNEPSTYVVSNINAGKWIIAGLSAGTYYVKVRLMQGSGDDVTYSAYGSAASPVKLSQSPDIPSLMTSTGVITKTGSVTCYWAYVSGDGTGQKQAQIYEAFPTYEAVASPAADANPYEEGYYELNGTRYSRSFDTEIVSGKTYYLPTGEMTYGESALRTTEQAQSITIRADEEDINWQPGETHHLVVRVMSMSGEQSNGFSAPVAVTIAEELSLEVTNSNLTWVPVVDDDSGDVISYSDVFSMTDYSLTFTLDGVGIGSTVTCIIERNGSYKVDRPDESDYEGFDGETIIMKTFKDGNITINQEDLIGSFDDGGSYKVTFILNDAYGQNVQTSDIPTGRYPEVEEPTGSPVENGYYEYVNDAYILSTDTTVDEQKTYYTKEYSDTFEVHWAHQATMPSALVEADTENNVTMITPIMPESGYAEGDSVDIYRLSADLPELIYGGAAFGTKYVDLYPAFGTFGGHRIVYRTKNGDYITDENQLAIEDYTADEDDAYLHSLFGIVIDFDNEQLILPYDVSFSNKWSKDFTTTKYLGGSVQGDWNPAVERTMSGKTTIPVEIDGDNIRLIRKLAVYPGICHIRTPDGSSFSANVDVNEDREEKWTRRIAKVSLDIIRCESEGSEALTYEDWQRRQQEEEE